MHPCSSRSLSKTRETEHLGRGELSSHAESARLSLLCPVHELQEEGAGLDWTVGPADTATPVNGLFQAISPSFSLLAGSFCLDQVLSLAEGHV